MRSAHYLRIGQYIHSIITMQAISMHAYTVYSTVLNDNNYMSLNCLLMTGLMNKEDSD